MILSNGQVVNFAPQALAESTPLVNATGYFYGSQGLQLERGFATYAQLYKTQPWVSTVVDKVANAVARLNLNVWDNSSSSGKVLDTTSRYAKLIANPNPFISNYDFWLRVISTFEVYGEGFLLKQRDDNGGVIAMLPMHPARTWIERAPYDIPEKGIEAGDLHYLFSAGVATANLLRAPMADVVPFLRFNPDNLMRGWSRLEPLRNTLMNEDSARNASSSWWRNMGRPGMVLKPTDPNMRMKREGKEKLVADWNALVGGSSGAGKTILAPDGYEPVQMQLNAEEMAYIQSRQINREEVCAVYDIPPPAVQILDHATFSNITEQMRSLYRESLAPRIEQIESILDMHLRPEFPGNKVARFAVDEVTRGDFETRAQAVIGLVANGVMMPSEARPLFDLDDAGEVANKLYANSALQPLGELKATETITVPLTEPVLGDDDLLASHTVSPVPAPAPATSPPVVAKPKPTPMPVPAPANKHVRGIMGKLGRGKSLAEVAAELLSSCGDADRDDILAALDVAAEKRGSK